MPDEKKELNDTNPTDEFLPEDLDSDWGEAWESAFEEEDDDVLSSSEEEIEDDFFLDEDEGTAGVQGASPGLQATATSPQSIESTETTEASETGQALAQAVAALLLSARHLAGFLFDFLAGLLPGIKQRYSAMPPRQKLMVGGGLVGLLCVVVIASLLSGPEEQAAPEMAFSVPATQQQASSPSAANNIAERADAGEDTTVTAMLPEKVRKKWQFPEFFIPVASQTGDKDISFLVVDITLVAVLDRDEELPQDKKAFIRDIIYQFYTNRPLFELRRYSLARGDMNRELRSWLQKQWPDGPIESIVFNKYQLT